MTTIKELKKLSFNEAFCYLQEKELGDWDNVNSEDIIKQYCSEMMMKGVHISHILEALETNASSEELYSIWLGNSTEIPTPINNISDLIEALEINEDDLKNTNTEEEQ